MRYLERRIEATQAFTVMAHVDVISDILAAVLRAMPHSDFVQGLSHQYLVKGGLSKRQLEGLYGKAQRIQDIPPGKLATLEAIILKKHQKHRSTLPANEPLFKPDQASQGMVDEILNKFPQHKRVLFLQAKLKSNDPLSVAETTELQKFHKLLIK